ncbi:ATP12 family chaperone protein [Litoreibacter roseus]|uniref:ATPase n=1 Tax=Litoreibacter roseus TaxID=2601869 RepID=A0A6N6JFL4_9RHOB|nr:ATP12 family protein [Litoreibacter roseus]GFE65143.1 ATPase [Litoreibacter roseus]
MADWAAKRFWKKSDVVDVDGGFGIVLDDRPLRTPAKSSLVLPTRDMATEVAREWDAQDGKIEPLTMPFTRSANAAVDKVATQHAEVVDLLAAYGDADLICYRADGPEGLVHRQAEHWDPLVDWAATDLKAPLCVQLGVMHEPQAPDSLARLRTQVAALDAFQLTAFHDLVSLSGSLVIGLAAIKGFETPEQLWTISRIDEDWQIEQWGEDEEASELAETKRNSFLHAHRFYTLSV